MHLRILCIVAISFSILVVSTLQRTTVHGEDSAVVLDDYDACGRVALYGACKLKGLRIGWEELKESFGDVNDDHLHSFATLYKTARNLGMHPIGVQATPEDLLKASLPAIVQSISSDQSASPHFLLLLSANSEGVWLLDAPHAHYFQRWSQFEKHWTGRTMLFGDPARGAARTRSMFASPASRDALYWTLVITPIVLIAAASVVVFPVMFPRRRRTLLLAAIAARKSRIIGRFDRVLGPSDRAMISNICLIGGAIIGAVLLSGLLVGGAVYTLAAIRHPPTISFAHQKIDLGEIPLGSRKIEIPFNNTGRRSLQIERVVSSCACTAANAPMSVEPGESASIEAELQVRGGPQGATLVVYGNDPRGPRHITVSWLGRTSPSLFPPLLNGEGVSGGDPLRRTVRLVYRSGSLLDKRSPRIKKIECEDARISVERGRDEPMAIPGVDSLVVGELELVVTISPPDEPGYIQSECNFLVEYGESEYSLRLPIAFEFYKGVHPKPDNVLFSAAAERTNLLGQRRVVSILNRMNATLEVRNSPPWLRYDLSAPADGINELSMEVVEIPPDSRRVDPIVVEIADDTELEIPARIFVLSDS